MIMEALRFRVYWDDIVNGVTYHSPALMKIAKMWYERVGLHYENEQMERRNHQLIQVKMKRAERYGRVRRNAIKVHDQSFPMEELKNLIDEQRKDKYAKAQHVQPIFKV